MIYKQSIFLFIADLTNLVELDLSYNFLSSIPVGALADLNNLKFLNLGSNKIQVKYLYQFGINLQENSYKLDMLH